MVTRQLRHADAVHRVYVRGVDGNLGTRVLVRARRRRRSRRRGRTQTGTPAAGRFDTIVELGVGDHDTRARRRESVTEAVGLFLADAEEASASHLVMVSSAMVYGAFSNNPVPDHRGVGVASRPRVRVRPSVGVGRGARRGVAPRRRRPIGDRPAPGPGDGRGRHVLPRARTRGRPRSPVRRGRSGRPVRAPRRRGVGGRARGRTPPRRRLQRGARRLDPRRTGARARPAIVSGSRCPSGCARSSARCAGGSSAARSRPGWVRTPASRGWSPTTSCDRRAGRRPSPTSRPTSRAPRRGGGRW